MKLVKELIKNLEIQLNNWLGSKILDYKIIVQIDATLELRLLVPQEFDEAELFEISNFKGHENIILISQVTEEEYESDKFDDNDIKEYYAHRRRLTRLRQPKNQSFDIPIITFYSYKGGLGRTTALACFASYLAMFHNKKVVVVDCDFEAPGFSNGNYFFLDTRKEICGVVEYLLDKKFKAHLEEKVDLREYAYTVDSSFTKGSNGQGEIYIIPSGNTKNQDTYLESLARIDLGYDLKGFIEDITKTFELTPENSLILFDSRTGFNDTFAALAEVSETIVGLFGVNQQNEAGIEFFVKHFLENESKNVFFVKGLGNEEERDELDTIIKSILENQPVKTDFYDSEKILFIQRDITELQNLGTSKITEEKFIKFLERMLDGENPSLRRTFKAITASVSQKNKPEIQVITTENIQISELPPLVSVENGLSLDQKIAQWQEDSSQERMFQLKFEFLRTIESPILWAERDNLERLFGTFYFRAVMRDIFNRNKFIIFGGKGSGKTYWYRLLEEKYHENEPLLAYLCRVEKKNRQKYIFINIVDENYQKIESVTGLTINQLQESDFKAFWILYIHYAVVNHPSISKISTSQIADNLLTFNEWVQTYLTNNSFNSVLAERELQTLNKKLKERNQELIISFDYLDKIVEMKYWKVAVSQLMRFWEKNPDYSHIQPKIFVRADLFNPEKIEVNNFLGLKNYSTINLSWSKDELFAYFFTSALKKTKTRDLFFHYLFCLENNQIISNAKKIIQDIDSQFAGETKQLAPITDDMKKLAILFFGERADFWGKNAFKYPLSYDWFVDNLQDALGQVSLRAFWELISLSVFGEGTETKTEYDRIKSKRFSEIYFQENFDHIKATLPQNFTRISQPFPLIEASFYTWKAHREDAAKQFFDEIKGEYGNNSLEDLRLFFTRTLQQEPERRKYNYLREEFETLISEFLEQEFNKPDSKIHQIINSKTEVEEIIRWLIGNGIVKEVITDYGDNTKYIFPYFYRSLFNLK